MGQVVDGLDEVLPAHGHHGSAGRAAVRVRLMLVHDAAAAAAMAGGGADAAGLVHVVRLGGLPLQPRGDLRQRLDLSLHATPAGQAAARKAGGDQSSAPNSPRRQGLLFVAVP